MSSQQPISEISQAENTVLSILSNRFPRGTDPPTLPESSARSTSETSETSETPPAKKKRLNYTLEFKNEVIQFAEKTNNCVAMKKFGVPRACIQRWRQMKNELAMEMEMGGGQSAKKKRLGGGGRPLKNVELDEKVEDWIRNEKGKITGKHIKEYAKMINDNKDFKASNGWLQRFMIRHGLAAPRSLKPSSSTSPSPSTPPESDHKDEQLQNLEKVIQEILDSGIWKPLTGDQMGGIFNNLRPEEGSNSKHVVAETAEKTEDETEDKSAPDEHTASANGEGMELVKIFEGIIKNINKNTVNTVEKDQETTT